MSVERARKFLSQFGMEDKIITFKESSATVELAAKAAGTEPARIAKTLSLAGKEHPFGVNEGVKVYLDISMKRFPTMFPAAGEENNAIELTPEELEKYTVNEGWVDLCKGWQNN